MPLFSLQTNHQFQENKLIRTLDEERHFGSSDENIFDGMQMEQNAGIISFRKKSSGSAR